MNELLIFFNGMSLQDVSGSGSPQISCPLLFIHSHIYLGNTGAVVSRCFLLGLEFKVPLLRDILTQS